MTTQGSGSGVIENHTALIGGLKRTGAWRVGGGVKQIALVGGASLDLTEALFEKGTDVTLTKIALVGGASLAFPEDVSVQVNAYALVGGVALSVPAGTRVELRGFTLLGGRSESGADEVADGSGAVIRVKRFSLLGGVSITRY